MDKALILLRGVPGSGKTTLANLLSENGKYPVLSIDDYFTDAGSGDYTFDYKKNHLAYAACQEKTEAEMLKGHAKIFVDNTFIFDWEMEPYHALAKKHRYTLFCMLVENYHGNKNTHHISDEDVVKMAARLKVKLF
ncbi:MAG: AAA family ATPase [Bacteroidetes bacterium]|nr:AAA family ATPase [Bacteroidota bacterium]